MRIWVYIVLVTFLLTGCKKGHAFDCFKSNGKETVETRQLTTFKQLVVFGDIQVKFIQAADYKVEVSAGEHIIGGISTDIKNGVLTIENLNACNIVRGYKREIKVSVYAPSIQKITNEGVSSVVVDGNLVQDSLTVRINSSGDFYVNGNYTYLKSESNGNGDMYLNGSAETLYVNTSGTNYVHAKELKVSKSMLVVTRTLGDVYVTATAQTAFEYSILGKGNIYLYGSPSLVRNLSEPGYSGQLIPVQ
jgi:Putative auto-transporter adhesin, head GIN domain